MIYDFGRSLVRTYVPIGVGVVAGAIAAQLGVELGGATVEATAVGLTGFTGAAWYGLARLVEAKVPALGFLIGAPGEPVYDDFRPIDESSQTVYGVDGEILEIHTSRRYHQDADTVVEVDSTQTYEYAEETE